MVSTVPTVSVVPALSEMLPFRAFNWLFRIVTIETFGTIGTPGTNLFVCGTRKAAVNDDDFAGDETVMQDQAQHAVGDVVFRAAAFERRVFGAAGHQPVIIFRQRPFHPLAFDPSRRHGVDADLGTERVG